MPTIRLPTAVGHLAAYRMGEPRALPDKAARAFNRVALAAAHVVADPLADVDPWLDVAIDWDRTIAFREPIWGLGVGVAAGYAGFVEVEIFSREWWRRDPDAVLEIIAARYRSLV
jgi:hypothetical protein